MDAYGQLLNEQGRAYICPRVGHDWRFALPLQTRDKTREALCRCATCKEVQWLQLPPDGYERLRKDAADGKITT